jgi:hypothetical protein
MAPHPVRTGPVGISGFSLLMISFPGIPGIEPTLIPDPSFDQYLEHCGQSELLTLESSVRNQLAIKSTIAGMLSTDVSASTQL